MDNTNNALELSILKEEFFGHMFADHVNKTKEQLIARAREKGISSTLLGDEEDLKIFIKKILMLVHNTPAYKNWRKFKMPDSLEIIIPMKNITSRGIKYLSVDKKGNQYRCDFLLLVLRGQRKSQIKNKGEQPLETGYKIETGYPISDMPTERNNSRVLFK